MLGIVYAFAAGAPTTVLSGGWSVLAAAGSRSGDWGRSPVPAAAFGLAAAAVAVAATSWNAIVRRRETAISVCASAVLTVLALSTVAFWRTGIDGGERVLLVAASVAAVALALHVVSARAGETQEDLVRGARIARDGLLILAGLLLALSLAVVRGTPSRFAAPAALATLLALFGVSLAALVAERRPRHVYFLGGALVGGYGFLRIAGILELIPSDDAVALLALDFALIGLTVVTRARFRRHRDRHAPLRRRTTDRNCDRVALASERAQCAVRAAAARSSTACASRATQRSRLLVRVGVVAATWRLLVLSLEPGTGGADIYLAPLGLCVLVPSSTCSTTA